MNTIEVVTVYGPSGAIGDKFPAIRLNDFLDWSNKREADIRELNDRLVERQESFQAQLIRIEDTWRERLKKAEDNTEKLYAALDDAISLIDRCSIDETPGDFHDTYKAVKAALTTP